LGGSGREPAASTTWDDITDLTRGQEKNDLRSIDAFAGGWTIDTFISKGATAFNSASTGEAGYHLIDCSGTADVYTVVILENEADTTVEIAIRLQGLHNLTSTDFML